jgi:hypothetical protein
MDDIGHGYLICALHLDRYLEGFVDAYFGPAELKANVQADALRPLEALADDTRQLQLAVEASDYDPQRQDFMTRQIRAMETVVRSLSGERLVFLEEVELYFDITPEMKDEALFEAAHDEMEHLLPGVGPLIERLEAWKKGLELPADRIMPVFDLARRETRRRTRDLFGLPAGEDVVLQLVQDQPWSAYNWYLGNYQSRIDLNTDLPVQVDHAVPLIAHEAYAGHHTEHAIKESRLYQQLKRGEHAVQLLLAPECVLSEGLADSALDLLFPTDDLAAFLRDELFPAAGLSGVDVELPGRIRKATADLRWVDCNAALLLHRDGRTPEEVQQYIEHYSLRTSKEAAHTMRFLQNPLYRSYVFNYAAGKALLAPLLEGPDAVDNFQRLLSEPLTPTQVHDWIAGRETK